MDRTLASEAGNRGSIPLEGTSIKLSGILPTDSAARSAAENGNTGSPRTARLAAFFDNFKFFFGGKFFRPITDKNNEFIS